MGKQYRHIHDLPYLTLLKRKREEKGSTTHEGKTAPHHTKQQPTQKEEGRKSNTADREEGKAAPHKGSCGPPLVGWCRFFHPLFLLVGGAAFRPPSEWCSFLLPATLGCTCVPRGRTPSLRMDICQIPRARCRTRVWTLKGSAPYREGWHCDGPRGEKPRTQSASCSWPRISFPCCGQSRALTRMSMTTERLPLPSGSILGAHLPSLVRHQLQWSSLLHPHSPLPRQPLPQRVNTLRPHLPLPMLRLIQCSNMWLHHLLSPMRHQLRWPSVWHPNLPLPSRRLLQWSKTWVHLLPAPVQPQWPSMRHPHLPLPMQRLTHWLNTWLHFLPTPAQHQLQWPSMRLPLLMMQRLTQVIEHVAPSLAGTYTAPAPVIRYVAPSPPGTCAPVPATVHAPAASHAAPAPVSDYVAPAASLTRAEATFEISGADGGRETDLPAEVERVVEAVVPESTYVTERWREMLTCQSPWRTWARKPRSPRPEVGPVAWEAQREEVVAEVLSAEADGNMDGSSPDPLNTMNSELECVWQLTKEMATKGELPAAAINVNECLKPHHGGIGRRPWCLERAVWLHAVLKIWLLCGCGVWRNSSKTGKAWEWSDGMTRGSGWPSARPLRMPSMRRIVGGSVGRAAPSASKSRSAVNLKCPFGHGIVTNWDATERNLASHFSLRLSAGPRFQASWSAWTKRSADIRFIEKEASGIHDTSRICSPMSCW